ncbi:MAG: peptidoglycan-binding domain-containing protein [Syntrophomonas sp.]|nr:peptidoglycan-binding domain-containing protein [Syntrophomonas sp.]
MKKEYYWFFVLILAAAVVAGSTLGITMNYKYISEQIMKERSQQEALEAQAQQKPASSPLEVKIPPQDMPPDIPQKSSNTTTPATTQSSTAVSSAPAPASGNGNKLLVLSQEEKRDIEMMLSSVGIPANTDYSQRIRQFQEKNTLTATGIMDSQTLGALINKVTINQANRHLGR